jgi:putative ABC transport system substrate-binding protein
MVDPTSTPLRLEIVSAAAKHRVPVIYAFREDVSAGGLISYGTPQAAQYAQAATLIAKILDGAQPRDLPVERPTKFEFAINLKAANALRLRVPAELLARADEVID